MKVTAATSLRKRLTGLCLCGLLLPAAAPAQPFTFQYLHNDLDQLSFGSIDWADVDRDGLLDVLQTGVPEAGPPYTPTTRLFLNRGATTVRAGENQMVPFQTFAGLDLPVRVWHSDAAWSDYDHDGDPDLFVVGAVNTEQPFVATARLLRNDGDGAFTPLDPGVRNLHRGSVAWGDYDHDGDEDLLLTGLAGEDHATLLYRNDGEGRFAEVNAGLVGVAFGEAAWGDYDRDGDLDILLSGVSEEAFVTRVYRNDDGAFIDLNAGLPGLAFSAVDWGDYDSDGDLDFVVAGGALDPRILVGTLYVYRNDGNDRFTPLLSDTGGFLDGEAAWGDFSNDGDLDLLVLGAFFPDGPRTTRVYENQGERLQQVLYLAGALFGDAAWGDVDGDRDLDVVLNGLARNANVLTNLYRNAQTSVNTPPEAPAGLNAAVAGGGVILSWNAAADEQTAAPGLTYNLRVGTAPGGLDVVAPLSDPETGRRLVAAPGNAFHNTAWRLKDFLSGTYYWSVQAVDASFVGSSFAPEGSFTISGTGGTSTAVAVAAAGSRYALQPNYPNPFRERTAIRYTLPATTPVRLAVYDVLGRRVKVLVDGFEEAGDKTAAWDGQGEDGGRVAAGVYVYRLETGAGYAQSRTMTVLR